MLSSCFIAPAWGRLARETPSMVVLPSSQQDDPKVKQNALSACCSLLRARPFGVGVRANEYALEEEHSVPSNDDMYPLEPPRRLGTWKWFGCTGRLNVREATAPLGGDGIWRCQTKLRKVSSHFSIWMGASTKAFLVILLNGSFIAVCFNCIHSALSATSRLIRVQRSKQNLRGATSARIDTAERSSNHVLNWRQMFTKLSRRSQPVDFRVGAM